MKIRNTYYWGCRNRENNGSPCTKIRCKETQVQMAFLTMVGKLYTNINVIIPSIFSLLEEIAARQERGNAKLYELNTALADLNEKAHTSSGSTTKASLRMLTSGSRAMPWRPSGRS